jgi:hypothetical protein
MKVDVRLGFDQADGLGVRDEMNFVAALGKFETEFRGYDAAATVGRVTGNSDIHEGFLSVRWNRADAP